MFYVIPYFELKMLDFYVYDYPIESWRALQIAGMLAAFYIFIREARRLGLKQSTVWTVSVLALFLVPFFEKLLFYLSHILLHTDGAIYHFTISGWKMLGRVYFGSFIGGILAVFIGTIITRQKANFFKYLDIALLAQIGQAFFYRIGNLLWHDHVGKVTDVLWGMYLGGQIRHEVSLYEVTSLVLLFLFVWPLRKKITKQPGLLFLTIMVWQSFSRCITDFFRSDDLYYSNFHFSNGLTLNQLAYGIVFLLCFGAILLIFKKHGKILFQTSDKTHGYEINGRKIAQ